MELKKVNKVVSKGYAKKDEISKKEIKKFTPAKWIAASAAGIVTLLYTSPKNSIHKIGIVFGCISMKVEKTHNYTSFWNITNSVMDVFYYASWILGVALVLLLGNHIFNRKKYDKDRRMKSIKNIKILVTMLIVSIIITALLVIFLKLDLNIFYE